MSTVELSYNNKQRTIIIIQTLFHFIKYSDYIIISLFEYYRPASNIEYIILSNRFIISSIRLVLYYLII